MESFWESLVSHWVAVGVIALLGVLLAYLKKKYPDWAITTLYGLAGAALITTILVGIVSFRAIPPRKARITAENLESNLRNWADENALAVARPDAGSVPDSYFTLLITLQNGNRLLVFRGKSKPNNLQIQSPPLAMTEEHQQLLRSLRRNRLQISFNKSPWS